MRLTRMQDILNHAEPWLDLQGVGSALDVGTTDR
jgi:hypothetical protein